jgi:NAD(P)-dependent dehydrogenase (short-subunit alcohol dehydrogenase family)
MMADTSPEIVARVTAPQAIKRIGEPEEVGAAVSFLCSDKAAFITGVTLPIDDGFLLGS